MARWCVTDDWRDSTVWESRRAPVTRSRVRRLRRFKLLALPADLVLQVAHWLAPADLLHLTMASRQVHDQLTTSLLLNAVRDDDGAAVLAHTANRAIENEYDCPDKSPELPAARKYYAALAKLTLLHQYGADLSKASIPTHRAWSDNACCCRLLAYAVHEGAYGVATCLMDLGDDVKLPNCRDDLENRLESTHVNLLHCVALSAGRRADSASAIALYSAVAAKTCPAAVRTNVLQSYLENLIIWPGSDWERSSARFILHLIALGAPVNFKDPLLGLTPLHSAVGFPHAVKVLLEHGANRHALSPWQHTPADSACKAAEKEEQHRPDGMAAFRYRMSMHILEHYWPVLG